MVYIFTLGLGVPLPLLLKPSTDPVLPPREWLHQTPEYLLRGLSTERGKWYTPATLFRGRY